MRVRFRISVEHPFNTYFGMGYIPTVLVGENLFAVDINSGKFIEQLSLAMAHGRANNRSSLSWCLGNTRMDTTTSNVANGLLFPYNRSAAIYHCPADKSTVETAAGEKLAQLRTRSYNMSLSVNGVPTLAGLRSFAKLTEINRPGPSELFVFLDVHEDEIFLE